MAGQGGLAGAHSFADPFWSAGPDAARGVRDQARAGLGCRRPGASPGPDRAGGEGHRWKKRGRELPLSRPAAPSQSVESATEGRRRPHAPVGQAMEQGKARGHRLPRQRPAAGARDQAPQPARDDGRADGGGSRADVAVHGRGRGGRLRPQPGEDDEAGPLPGPQGMRRLAGRETGKTSRGFRRRARRVTTGVGRARRVRAVRPGPAGAAGHHSRSDLRLQGRFPMARPAGDRRSRRPRQVQRPQGPARGARAGSPAPRSRLYGGPLHLAGTLPGSRGRDSPSPQCPRRLTQVRACASRSSAGAPRPGPGSRTAW
jgi:hypothetical protein